MMLKPLSDEELQIIFDNTALEVLRFCMKKTLMAQPERVVGQSQLPIQVPKEHIEQWVVQAIGAIPIGAGSYPIDVIKGTEFGADIKMLSCKVNASGELSNAVSGETSLAQKFTNAGVDLDTAFANKEYVKITKDWCDILKNKLGRIKKEQGLETVYYIFILRAATKFYLCATKVNLDMIDKITANIARSTSTSTYVNNLIDDKFGEAKIYKSKKRLELRLKPKYWVDNNYAIEFDFSEYMPTMVDLRELVKSEGIREHLERLTEDILNV